MVLNSNINRNNLHNVLPCKFGLSDNQCLVNINLYNSSGNNSIYEWKIPKQHLLKNWGRIY
jgi:hypothetical protein